MQMFSTSLGGNTRVDSLIECAVLSFVGSQILLVLLEHFLIVLSESRDLVNVLDRLVWAVRGNLTCSARVHPPVTGVHTYIANKDW